MKRFILLALALTFCVSMVFAQYQYGIRGGINIAGIGGDDDVDDAESKFGFHIGGMMLYPINENFVLQPELLITQKGWKWEDSSTYYGSTYSWDEKATSWYMEIPVLAKYKYDLPSFQLQPYIGPSLGFLLSARYKIEENEDGDTYEYDGDLKHTSALELGLNLGVDALFSEKIMAGIRYNYGLTNIFDDDDYSDAKNRVWMLNLGYLLN